MPPKDKAPVKPKEAPPVVREDRVALFAWVKFGVVDDPALSPLHINIDVRVDILLEYLKRTIADQMASYIPAKLASLREQASTEPGEERPRQFAAEPQRVI